jgi:hypothetical protein
VALRRCVFGIVVVVVVVVVMVVGRLSAMAGNAAFLDTSQDPFNHRHHPSNAFHKHHNNNPRTSMAIYIHILANSAQRPPARCPID